MKKNIETWLKEFLTLIGASLIWYGLYLIYPPVSYIIVGAGFIWFAYPKR